MAKIEPPKKVLNKIPKVAAKVDNITNLTATNKASPVETKPLQLQVPANIKNEYKAYCASSGRSMSEVFLEMFSDHKEKHATL
ncbi:MAG: hypothetical protein O2970_11175 [Proteobacteria bacterium]|nr:hypothetical protein [Pseudomonadota bacterium]